jgi:hypothetical protein
MRRRSAGPRNRPAVPSSHSVLVKYFIRAGATKQSAAPTKPFLVPHENNLKPTWGDNVSVQTMGDGRVGIHHQPDLPRILQEIFDGHPKAQVEYRDGRLMQVATAIPPGPVASRRYAAFECPALEQIRGLYIAACSQICPPARLGALSCWKLSPCSSAS